MPDLFFMCMHWVLIFQLHDVELKAYCVFPALDKGHTGNVRFLTFAELLSDIYMDERRRSVARQSLVTKMLVVSGGDGYEETTLTDQSKDTIGFNDSINHLLVWKM